MDRPFPAYKGEEPYVFVSYSHKDSDAVFPEISWLKDQGINIWYDAGIEGGTEWRGEIAEAITNASLFIYFVTPESVQSENCLKEVNFADKNKVRILAVHLQPVGLTGSLDLTLSDRQAILKYETKQDEYAVKLLDGIRKLVPGNEADYARVVAKTSLGNRLLRSRSIWVVIGLLVISAILMSVNESRAWITQTAIATAFNAALMFSSHELEVEGASRHP